MAKKDNHDFYAWVAIGSFVLLSLVIVNKYASQGSYLGASTTYLARDGQPDTTESGSGDSEQSGPPPTNINISSAPATSNISDSHGQDEHRSPPPARPTGIRFILSPRPSPIKEAEPTGELENEDVNIQRTDDETIIKNGTISAQTHFPLTIDQSTHTLTVTTPAGNKTVTVLPAAAANNLISKGVVDVVENTNNTIPLVENNNELVFAIQGTKQKHFLGILPVTINKTVNVSAQSGDVVTTNESLTDKLLEALSF